uniref:Uncharacterized protein n=1 Tax=Peronospora matthiolae TaxID=2874970 RepID=A0AAV1TX42_9STRA
MRTSYLFALFTGVKLLGNADISAGLKRVKAAASDASASEYSPKELLVDHSTNGGERESRLLDVELLKEVIAARAKSFTAMAAAVAGISDEEKRLYDLLVLKDSALTKGCKLSAKHYTEDDLRSIFEEEGHRHLDVAPIPAAIPALLDALHNEVGPLNVAIMVLLMRDDRNWAGAAKMVERAQFVKFAIEGVSSEELEVYLNAMAHYSKKKRGFYFVRAAVGNYRKLLVDYAKRMRMRRGLIKSE